MAVVPFPLGILLSDREPARERERFRLGPTRLAVIGPGAKALHPRLESEFYLWLPSSRRFDPSDLRSGTNWHRSA
jgi:hypothetical protein